MDDREFTFGNAKLAGNLQWLQLYVNCDMLRINAPVYGRNNGAD